MRDEPKIDRVIEVPPDAPVSHAPQRVLGSDGQPAAPQAPEEKKYFGWYAYETIGYTPIDPHPPIPTVEEIAARFRDAMVPYVGRSNVTPELVATIKTEVAKVLNEHRAEFSVETVPEESTPDRLTIRIKAANPHAAELLRRAMEGEAYADRTAET